MNSHRSQGPRNAKGRPARGLRGKIRSKVPIFPSVNPAPKTKGPSPIPKGAPGAFPMRINKYLAMKGNSTRRGADELILKKFVILNGRTAMLGDKVHENDVVEIRRNNKKMAADAASSAVAIGTPAYVYYAFNKPPGVNLETAAHTLPLQDVFPVLSLDREAEGLVILTNDRRIIDRLSNASRTGSVSAASVHVAENAHMKEYLIRTRNQLKHNFKEKLEKGVVLAPSGNAAKSIDGKMGKQPVVFESTVKIVKDNLFILKTADNGNHIRHVCSLFLAEIESLTRTRIGTLELANLASGKFRPIEGEEREIFLKELGL